MTSTMTKEKIWGTFKTVRPLLERQYETKHFDAGSGLSIESLEALVREHIRQHPEQSRVLQKAHAFRIILHQARIRVDPHDFFADHLQHGNILNKLQNEWRQEIAQTRLTDQDAFMRQAIETGYLDGELDLGHTSPGWQTMLSHGLYGLLEIARKNRRLHGETLSAAQIDFYDALEIVYNAIVHLAGRFSRLAEEESARQPQYSGRLQLVASALNQVPAHPPRTLHEALQFSYLMHQLIEMEGERVRSMGGFDRLYRKYYESDLESGRLDREQAKELIRFFWIKFFAQTRGIGNGKNFYFAGCHRDGSDAVNDLSYLAMEVYDELDTTDPKLSVRVGSQTPDALLHRITQIMRQGKTSFVLVNDEVTIPALQRYGKTLEDARDYLLIGCYEPAVEGKEIACNMSLKINLAKAVELALHQGIDPVSQKKLGPRTKNPRDMTDFNSFLAAVLEQIDAQIDQATRYICHFETFWPEINPSPVLAGTFLSCLESGRDIGQAGPQYNNTGCMGAGLANAADSLIAVKKLVFDEKSCSMDELIAAAESDFKGYEDLQRRIVYALPKWGNAEPDVDALACQIAQHYSQKVNDIPNTRGGFFRASMFTLDHRYSFGRRTGATPDGRVSKEPLAVGIGAMTGRDRKGVTAHIRSVTKIDFHDIPNGSVLDIFLHPSAVRGDEGLAAFKALIRTYFACGGYAIQFNIFDTETLEDARLHPEKYQTLQVRVCGWNVYFTSLSAEEQEQFILANKHGF